MQDPALPRLKRIGIHAISALENIGLLLVLAATVVAAGQEVAMMAHERTVRVTDLLLLFIYIEIVTMCGIYWRIGRLPVQMPLYIAMVALARHMTLETHDVQWVTILVQAVAILLLASAVLVVRFGQIRYPYKDGSEHARLT